MTLYCINNTKVESSECSSPPTTPFPVLVTLLTSSATIYPDVMERVNGQRRYSANTASYRVNGEDIFPDENAFDLRSLNQTASKLRVRIAPASFTGDPVSFSCFLPLTGGGEDSSITRMVDPQGSNINTLFDYVYIHIHLSCNQFVIACTPINATLHMTLHITLTISVTCNYCDHSVFIFLSPVQTLPHDLRTFICVVVNGTTHAVYHFLVLYFIYLLTPPPPPHSASYNIAATTTCASRVSASVGHRKRPPVQVTIGTTTCASRVSALVGH